MTYPTQIVPRSGDATDLPLDQNMDLGSALFPSSDMERVSRMEGDLDPEFRRKLPDPAHPWLLGPPLTLTFATLITESMAAEPLARSRSLAEAVEIAAYLRNLYQAMPPRTFDIHVHHADPKPVLLRNLIETKVISTHPSAAGCWISADEARIFISAGESFTDPASAWYVNSDDWIDRDGIEVLIAEHSRRWPELYGGTPSASISAASL